MAQSTVVGGAKQGRSAMRGEDKRSDGASASHAKGAKASAARASAKEASVRTATKPARGAGRARLKGLEIERHYTTKGVDPLDEVVWERRSSVITNTDGSVVFKMEGAEIPAEWSQLATDIVVSKYFRKAGIHGDKAKGETSVRDVVTRLARTIREVGEELGGYFASTKDADAFEAELSHMLVSQKGAFNSPVWFNCGLFHRYGITGSGGNYAVAWDVVRGHKGATIDRKSVV